MKGFFLVAKLHWKCLLLGGYPILFCIFLHTFANFAFICKVLSPTKDFLLQLFVPLFVSHNCMFLFFVVLFYT